MGNFAKSSPPQCSTQIRTPEGGTFAKLELKTFVHLLADVLRELSFTVYNKHNKINILVLNFALV